MFKLDLDHVILFEFLLVYQLATTVYNTSIHTYTYLTAITRNILCLNATIVKFNDLSGITKLYRLRIAIPINLFIFTFNDFLYQYSKKSIIGHCCWTDIDVHTDPLVMTCRFPYNSVRIIRYSVLASHNHIIIVISRFEENIYYYSSLFYFLLHYFICSRKIFLYPTNPLRMSSHIYRSYLLVFDLTMLQMLLNV